MTGRHAHAPLSYNLTNLYFKSVLPNIYKRLISIREASIYVQMQQTLCYVVYHEGYICGKHTLPADITASMH